MIKCNRMFFISFLLSLSVANDLSQDEIKLLFIKLYKMVLPFDSVDEILKCNHLN